MLFWLSHKSRSVVNGVWIRLSQSITSPSLTSHLLLNTLHVQFGCFPTVSFYQMRGTRYLKLEKHEPHDFFTSCVCVCVCVFCVCARARVKVSFLMSVAKQAKTAFSKKAECLWTHLLIFSNSGQMWWTTRHYFRQTWYTQHTIDTTQ